MKYVTFLIDFVLLMCMLLVAGYVGRITAPLPPPAEPAPPPEPEPSPYVVTVDSTGLRCFVVPR